MNTNFRKDIIFLAVSSLISFALVYVTWLNDEIHTSMGDKITTKTYFGDNIFLMIIAVLVGIFVCSMAYFEAKHDDNYFTGVMQTKGVVNSFTSACFLNLYLYFLTDKWYILYIIMIVVIMILRYFGRKKRAKLLEFVGKKGVMKTNLHNHGIAIIEGKEMKVYSSEDIYYGSEVEISELKAKYFYVKKCV